MKNELGKRGERIAATLLQSKGYRLVDKRFRIPAMGEIDFICENRNALIFVEVKLRRKGKPEESVDEVKIEKLKKMAEVYLSRHPTRKEVRFDVVTVLLNEAGLVEKIRHIPEAF